ncbi:MAG: DNA-formamidopyrimidine glycosylase [Verrucomicrobia bacterium]|jgi:formamidopyrimidine-DNA glycosylase|nr:DNA-formamidopyrimidine glycosylase [Verrucomicrobiota bacterium]
MPELPEVEVLVRHLDPLVKGQRIKGVMVRREKVIRPTTPQQLAETLTGATLQGVTRRAKFLLFQLKAKGAKETFPLVAHLGMTGRIFLQAKKDTLPKHAAVVLDLGTNVLVFEDTRYFGRFTLDASPLDALGPEPLTEDFDVAAFSNALKRSSQPIKVKLLDQTLIAGVGNIYASESLFRAGVSPKRRSDKLKSTEVVTLLKAIQEVLAEAIQFGSTIPLDYAGTGKRDGLFYYGQPVETPNFYEERLLVYDRFEKPCVKCQTLIRRFVQATRSTYFCPKCQR